MEGHGVMMSALFNDDEDSESEIMDELNEDMLNGDAII